MLLLILIASSTPSSSLFLTTLTFSIPYSHLSFLLFTPTYLILYYYILIIPSLLYSETASERDSISTLSTPLYSPLYPTLPYPTLLYSTLLLSSFTLPSTLHYTTLFYSATPYITLLYPTNLKALRYLTFGSLVTRNYIITVNCILTNINIFP